MTPRPKTSAEDLLADTINRFFLYLTDVRGFESGALHTPSP
jgi:hypothetical protein